MSVKQADNLASKIQVRYAKEADVACCLSCGGALDYADVKSGEKLADLGSGRGLDVIKAARKAGKDGFAYGIDFTDEMLKAANNNAKKMKVANVSFIKGSIDEIPLEDNSLDVVISNCTINHAKDKAKVYKEIYRILKIGGRFVVSDVIAAKKLPDFVVNDPEAWAACYGGAITEEENFNAIGQAGFPDIDILEESKPYEKGGVMVFSMTMQSYKFEI